MVPRSKEPPTNSKQLFGLRILRPPPYKADHIQWPTSGSTRAEDENPFSELAPQHRRRLCARKCSQPISLSDKELGEGTSSNLMAKYDHGFRVRYLFGGEIPTRVGVLPHCCEVALCGVGSSAQERAVWHWRTSILRWV